MSSSSTHHQETRRRAPPSNTSTTNNNNISLSSSEKTSSSSNNNNNRRGSTNNNSTTSSSTILQSTLLDTTSSTIDYKKDSIDKEPIISTSPTTIIIPSSSNNNSSSSSNKTARRILIVILILLIIYRLTTLFQDILLSSSSSYDDDDESNNNGLPPPSKTTPPPKKEKTKKMLRDADVIQLNTKSGWTPQTGNLVEKRPPRSCSKTKITPQVFDPIVYLSKERKGWKRRAYSCLLDSKEKKCRSVILEDAEDRRWKLTKNLDSTFVFTNKRGLEKSPDFNALYRKNEGSIYLDVILGGPVLNGESTVARFEALRRYVRSFGCSVNDLSAQTPRFRLSSDECKDALDLAQKNVKLNWGVHEISPNGGGGGLGLGLGPSKITLYTSGELIAKLQNCKLSGPLNDEDKTSSTSTTTSTSSSSASDYSKTEAALAQSGGGGVIVQEPIKYLTIDKQRFEIRSFVLIGSTMPFMVFFRQGYVRTLPASFSGGRITHASFDSQETRDMSLENFQRLLANGKVTGTHFVDTFLKSSMKRVAMLLFQAARPHFKRRRGSYQLFALDFIVDDQLRTYFEDVDPYPDLDISPSAFEASALITDVHDLVMELQEEPTAFEPMITGDKYGKFELIFSEVRETCEGTLYNPCHLFHDFNAVSLAKANRKVSIVHNAANREHHEETRIVKKLGEELKAKCKEQKLLVESKACEKLGKQLDEAEFERLFKEHEKTAWNVNSFRLPKPGEVFPWEIV
jgi:hypothetical protein